MWNVVWNDQMLGFFVDIMMAEELQLQVPEKDHEIEAMKEGVVMFYTFAIFGAFSLL